MDESNNNLEGLNNGTNVATIDESSIADAVESVVAESIAETPVVEVPVVAESIAETPVVETPVAETPVVETPIVETPVAEVPTVETPSIATELAQPINNEPKKNNSLTIILIILVILLAAGLVYFAVFKDCVCPEEKTCDVLDENKIIAEYAEKEELLRIANEYVASAKDMWDNGKITCQNQYAEGVDKENIQFVIPSQLAKTDAYGGEAIYYLFIDNENSNEIDFGVKTDKKIGGWIKFGVNGSVFVAISDGTNYLVDKGDGVLQFKDVTYKDVISGGNGNNYQFKNNMILGSQTDGNGWGIGDYAIMSDNDDSNNGIYMTNGDKNTGWTPYCK